MANIHSLYEKIQDSVARQQEWGTDNFIGGPDGTDLRGMSEGELAQYWADQQADRMAEAMGQGITRRGGNY